MKVIATRSIGYDHIDVDYAHKLGLPIGNMPLILGTQKGYDCTSCSAAIIMTTLLCVVTIPILIGFV